MAHFTLLRSDLMEAPSTWVVTHAQHIKPSGHVLDVAAGSGRNARWLAQQGFMVEAVDIDANALSSIQGVERIQTRVADIESQAWPYDEAQFDAIIVCRYLYRPLFSMLLSSLKPGGILIYETFMHGHETYGRPTNPDFLLHPDELSQVFSADMEIVAFTQGYEDNPKPAMMQRLCAIKRAPG